MSTESIIFTALAVAGIVLIIRGYRASRVLPPSPDKKAAPRHRPTPTRRPMK